MRPHYGAGWQVRPTLGGLSFSFQKGRIIGLLKSEVKLFLALSNALRDGS